VQIRFLPVVIQGEKTMLVEIYYCTFCLYGLFGKQKFVTKAIALALEIPVMGRIFGIW
jgi:hypothetical protein